MEFHTFARIVNSKFDKMQHSDLFRVKTEKGELSEVYLDSFPQGSNQLYIERTEHDCNTCKQFIERIGNAVSINPDGTLDTIWNVEGLSHPYDVVAESLHNYVSKKQIQNVFLFNEASVGKEKTLQQLENGRVKTWKHFHTTLISTLVDRDWQTALSKTSGRAETHKRSLQELSAESIEITLDLLESGSIYRGSEHTEKVRNFLRMKKEYDSSLHKDAYIWRTFREAGAGIRNSVIGTLIQDINDGKDIENAVKSFEDKVAPSNYKRPKAVVTKKMMESAIKEIDKAGIRDSLLRRQAVSSDVSVNDVLFVDRNTKLADKDPLMELLEPQTSEVKGLGKAKEIGIDEFIKDVLPNTTELSIVTGRDLQKNKVQISAPTNPDAPNILQWDNNFSWSYSGNVADSNIKEKVKDLGGNVDGYLRFSIQWNEDGQDGNNDLDAHAFTPKGEISFKRCRVGLGILDVDIITPQNETPDGVAVENITWKNAKDCPDGKYTFFVYRYSGENKGGFRAEIAIGDDTYSYDYSESMKSTHIEVATVIVKDGKFSIHHKLPSTSTDNSEFVKVKMVTLSPNFWNESNVGNKHFFFLTEEEQESEPFRGFYNEFLSPKLHDIRKSMDLISSKMMVTPIEQGLHGYGFSSTIRKEFFIKADNRLYKIKV